MPFLPANVAPLIFSDWIYWTEGGHHVVLRYKGEEQGHFKHLVLRIEKNIESSIFSSNHSINFQLTNEMKYLCNVMEPFLSACYVLAPQYVELSSDFIFQLNRHLFSDATRIRREMIDESCIT